MTNSNNPISGKDNWPSISYLEWEDTCATLQLWTQIVGKVRLALTPWINHSWHVVLYLTARGLTTSPIPHFKGSFQMDFDFLSHELVISRADGTVRQLSLKPQSVADFYQEALATLNKIGIDVVIDLNPNEIQNAIPFSEDQTHRSYDKEPVQRFFRALLSSYLVFLEFRSGYLGKVSPPHFFWGSFDLAVTRFSGQRAPLHPGGSPGLPDPVTQEAYSHELSSAGFWPGNGGLGYPAYYCYAYPEPEGFAQFPVGPKEAFYHQGIKEFILPYEAVQQTPNPEGLLMEFLESTYKAAAEKGAWNRKDLECQRGLPRKPRQLK